MIPPRKNSHKIGTFYATSKARPNQNLITIASMTPTKIPMTSKISWRMTLILKETNLKLWGEKKISKGNESAYAGINYKDEPTQKSEKLKQSRDDQNSFQNRKKPTWITNGFN
jgi:hypothetical protein